jgi:hypothetical protein
MESTNIKIAQPAATPPNPYLTQLLRVFSEGSFFDVIDPIINPNSPNPKPDNIVNPVLADT